MSTLVNLFEDPESIIREGGWLKLINGAQVVPDDYGVAFVVHHKDLVVCAPLPWHTVYNWAYRLYWWWRVGAGCQSNTIVARAFDAGVDMERLQGVRRAAVVHGSHVDELQTEFKRGYERGQQELMQELRAIFAAEKGDDG